MAKMDWWRVRLENLARRSGSEWIGSNGTGTGSSSEARLTGKAASRGSMRAARMPGCTCGKAVGFAQQHKKKCALSNGHRPGAIPRTSRQPSTRSLTVNAPAQTDSAKRHLWRKVEITSCPTTGFIVLEYHVSGKVTDAKRYSAAEFVQQSREIARSVGHHVTPA
jgi:hypothetical protein